MNTMKQVKFRYIVLLLAAVLIFAACGKKDEATTPPASTPSESTPSQTTQQPSNNEPAAPADPTSYTGGKVEITLYDHNTGLSEEEFNRLFVANVQAKFPDITITKLEGIRDDMFAAGVIPDIVTMSNPVINQYLELDYPDDLSEMIKRLNIDMGLFEPTMIDLLNSYGADRGTIGIPFGGNTSVLLLNEDLFNRFGVDLPTGIITAEEYVELARQLTRNEDGVQYIGGNWHEVSWPNASGLSYIDPNDKDKINLGSEGLRYVFTLMQRLYSIEGHMNEENRFRYSDSVFWKDQQLVTTVSWLDNTLRAVTEATPNFTWNVHAQPVIWKDRPSANSLDFHLMMVSKVSKNKEAAYRVLYTLAQPETQAAMNRAGRLSAYKDPVLKQEFAKEAGVFEGKNLASVFSIGPTPLPPFTEHLGEADAGIREVAKALAIDKEDLNTAIRRGEELANQRVREKLAAK